MTKAGKVLRVILIFVLGFFVGERVEWHIYHPHVSQISDTTEDSNVKLPYEYPSVPYTLGVPPPSQVEVGPYTYRIEFRDSKLMEKHFHDLGWSFGAQQIIIVDAGLTGNRVRETVLHELMHACQDAKDRDGVEEPMTADEFIERTAPTLIEVLQRNPQLVEWLTQPELHPEFHTGTSKEWRKYLEEHPSTFDIQPDGTGAAWIDEKGNLHLEGRPQ